VADKIEKLLVRVGKLPTMPHVAAKTLELVGNPETTTKQLQGVIDSDQVLAMRILKVANSALYALPRKVKVLSEAIVMLGFNHIRSLVLAEAIQNLFKGKGKRGDLLESLLWEHSVGAAFAAKCLAQLTQPSLSEQAFVGALIHDIGKLILLQGDPKAYQEIIQSIYNEYQPFTPLEREEFGLGHAEVGATLAERWNLDEQLTIAIRTHHEEDEPGADELCELVRLGNAMSWKAEWGFRKEPDLVLADHPAAQRLGIGADKLEEALERAGELMVSERETFGIPSLNRSRHPAPDKVPTPS